MRFYGVARGQVRSPAEPAGEHGFPAQAASLAGQNDKDGLRNFLGHIRVAHLPQSGGVHQSHIAPDEFRERSLGLTGGEFRKQCGVAG